MDEWTDEQQPISWGQKPSAALNQTHTQGLTTLRPGQTHLPKEAHFPLLRCPLHKVLAHKMNPLHARGERNRTGVEHNHSLPGSLAGWIFMVQQML